MKSITRLAAVILLGLILAFVTGCNTIEGAGEDIERGGERIQEAAD